jgi:predicted dienelactone hydrolase
VVVFAHGFDAEPETYLPLLDAWAAAGYLVAAPEFPGSAANLPGTPIETDIAEQAQDVSFVISQLLSGVAGPLDPTRIAVAGHSDGGSTQ